MGRTIYINEAWKDNYPAMLTRLPLPLGRPVFFSEEDAYAVHFPHNDTLVMAIHIGCYKVSKILVGGESNVNILYGHTLDRMEDTLELARKMIIPQTQLLLYGFDESEARSPSTVEFPVRADLYNIIIEFCSLTSKLPITLSPGGHGST